jgi:hypothetical protein
VLLELRICFEIRMKRLGELLVERFEIALAGFFLFLGTLVVNMIANLIVSRTGRLQK